MSKISSALAALPLRRWLPFLLLVVLLHLIVIRWALSPFAIFLPSDPAPQIISADLHLNPVPRVAQEAPKPRVTRRLTPAAKPSTAEPEAAEPEAAAPDDSANTETPTASDPPPPVASVADDSPKPLSLGTLPHYAINPPPSAELRYNAHSSHKGQDIHGSGRILWQSSGSNFGVKGEFNILFLSLLNFNSVGTIDPKHGLSPLLYAEKRMRRAETNTHFQRERNVISFSASTLAYERPGGEQDRASIVWQLVGIGRRDGSQFAPGADLDIAVAGIRDAVAWKIHIIGIEEVDTGLGKVRAWRLSRTARKGTYEQSLDVWLAPQHEWYPVKLRYTNANGDFLDLSLSEIKPAP